MLHACSMFIESGVGLFMYLHQQVSALQPTLLVELDVSDNQLAQLPDEVGSCEQLRGLDASRFVTGAPPLTHEAHLFARFFRRNQLMHIPATVHHLTRLVSLKLAHNRLVSLPPELGGCHSLTTLDLRANGFVSLLVPF
jgi:leucine-rich repeat protein SHOC2